MKNPLMLAPMASLTHRPLREVIHHFGGCDLYFTEMISAPALLNGGHLEKYYIDPGPSPTKLVYQLVGSENDSLVKAAGLLNSTQAYGIDINMGCSAPLIAKQGAGVSWMKTPSESWKLIENVRRVTPDKTLSVKIRLGFQEDLEQLVHFCQGMVNNGVDRITLHPRIAKQKFKRTADWKHVEFLQKALSIPVAGNGDIKDISKLREKMKGPWDGVMVGRFAIQKPWIFAEARGILQGKIDVLETALLFLAFLRLYQPEEFWISRAQKFFSYYLLNIIWHHDLFTRLNREKSLQSIERLLEEYFSENPQERFKETIPPPAQEG